MLRRRHLLASVATAGLLTLALIAPASAHQPVRPFWMQTNGYATFMPERVDPITGEACAHFGGLATLGYASGIASHLGRVSMTSDHCTPFADEPVTGRMALVAANGDKLVFDYFGPVTGSMGEQDFVGVYELTVVPGAGTGRFAGAHGSGSLTVALTFEAFDDLVWPGSFSITGQIAY